MRRRFFKGDLEFVLLAHAVIRAIEREIPWDLLESTLNTGSFKKFGKNMVRIRKRFRRGSIVCIGERIGEYKIKIITIEWGS